MNRESCVAGQFYPGDAKALEKDVKRMLVSDSKKVNAIGCMSPHAGYMYSGAVAGQIFGRLMPKRTYVILGPNHTGMGKPFGVDIRDWQTPLGKVECDKELAEKLLRLSDIAEPDAASHNREHSIEVQLPFLQVLNKEFKFLPICIGGGDIDDFVKLGKDIADAIKEENRDVMVIASSDMTHYEPQENAIEKDKMVIDSILQLDVEGFLGKVKHYDVSMCGYAPTAVMLSASLELGAEKAELVKYQTSGDVNGDYSAVVGYAGIIVY